MKTRGLWRKGGTRQLHTASKSGRRFQWPKPRVLIGEASRHPFWRRRFAESIGGAFPRNQCRSASTLCVNLRAFVVLIASVVRTWGILNDSLCPQDAVHLALRRDPCARTASTPYRPTQFVQRFTIFAFSSLFRQWVVQAPTVSSCTSNPHAVPRRVPR